MKSAGLKIVSKKNQFKTITSPLALIACALFPAWAQAEEAANEADETEIVVSGSILQAQAASVEEKRKALNLVDVAAADSVGRFPDQNSAAALARLPAVAVQRDQGQEALLPPPCHGLR